MFLRVTELMHKLICNLKVKQTNFQMNAQKLDWKQRSAFYTIIVSQNHNFHVEDLFS